MTVLTPCGRCMLRDGWLGVKRKFEKNAFAGRNRREPDAPAPACPPAWHGRLLAPVCVRVLSRFGCLLPHCLRQQTMRLPGTARGRPNALLESLLQSMVGVVRGGEVLPLSLTAPPGWRRVPRSGARRGSFTRRLRRAGLYHGGWGRTRKTPAGAGVQAHVSQLFFAGRGRYAMIGGNEGGWSACVGVYPPRARLRALRYAEAGKAGLR